MENTIKPLTSEHIASILRTVAQFKDASPTKENKTKNKINSNV